MPIDRERLVKVLQQTDQENDASTLVAIRMANKMLRDHKLTWDKVVSGANVKVKVFGDAPSFIRPAPNITLKQAFTLIEAERGLAAENMYDMYAHWKRTGHLSPKDQRVVMEMAQDIQRELS